MITGDKQETAVNIGVACRLLRDPGRLLRCNAQEGGEKGADARLAELLEATAPWAEDGGKRKKLICTAAGSSSSSSSAAPAATATAAAAAVSNNSNSAAAPYPSDVTMRPAPISTATTPGESGAGALATGRTSGTGGGSDATRATTAATLTTVAATAAAWQLPPALPPPPTGASSPYLFLPLPLPSAVPAALYSSPRPPELVIDGRTLSHVLGRPEAEAALAELATRCSSVVVCRASPSQKAGIVRMMKARRERARLLAAGGARLLAGPPGSAASMALPSMALRDRLLRAITHPVLTVRAATSSASNNECLLAIGDGANDVAMLQAADIGVGLLGKEGRQAANNADFAFARFASLPRLLLVHGTLADHRLARLIKYSFYKNVAFAAMLLCFQFFSGFSGQALLDGVTSAFYNAFFTALPAGFFAGLDRPVRHLATLEAAPRAYNSRPALTARSFWRTSVLSGAVQGAVRFFFF
jgi:magnesium-transporting ATPase (P-type)